MTQRTVNPTYLALALAFGLLSAPAFGYAAWSFYDATVTYPDRIKRYEQFEQLQRDHPDDAHVRWLQVANANDWPTAPPMQIDQMAVVTQYILGGFCSLTGLTFAIAGGRVRDPAKPVLSSNGSLT